jgi:hypothetical protein
MSESADSSLHQGRYCVRDDSVPLADLRMKCLISACFIVVFYTLIVLNDKYDVASWWLLVDCATEISDVDSRLNYFYT